jgi:hypothetical protein
MAIELARPEALQAPAGPTRSPYRFRLIRWSDWHEEGYLPLRNCTVSWKRGDVGRLDASLPLAPGAPPVRPAEQLLVVEQDGEPIWGGMVWSVGWSTGAAYAVVRGSEWQGMLKRRRIRRDLRFEQMDQFDIARSLAIEAQAGGTGGTMDPADLHIDPWQGVGVEAPMSGVLRDRTYLGVERKQIFEALAQLSQVINGFDWYLRPAYRNGGLVFLLSFDYPPSERRSDLVLEYKQGWSGSSVIDYSWPWDGSNVVNRAEAANDEEVQTAEDAGAWTRFPLLEDLVQQGGEHGATRSETLLEHAQAFLLQDRLPRSGGQLVLRSDLRVTPDILGSRVRFRATSWRHQGEGGRPGFDQELVVNEVQMNLPSDERPLTTTLQAESIQWELGRALGFRGGAGRMVESTNLTNTLRQIQSRQDLALGEVRRVVDQVGTIAEETGVAPPEPPPPEPPPQPPPVETIEVKYNAWGNLGNIGGASRSIGDSTFFIGRGGQLHVEAGITVQPIFWNNNEGMGFGTRRVSFEILNLWRAGSALIGGNNPNWAGTYVYTWDEWWGVPVGGTWTVRFWFDLGGGNQVVVHNGWYRVTFVG